MKRCVAETVQTCTAMNIRQFQKVIDHCPPSMPVRAKRFAQMLRSVIEGAHPWPSLSQPGQYRLSARAVLDYLELMFPTDAIRDAA